MEQDLLTFPKHPRSRPVFGGVRFALSLVFYVVSSLLLLVCLSLFLAMALSIYFQSMSLTVPLVYFVPLLFSVGKISYIDIALGVIKYWIRLLRTKIEFLV